MAHWFDYRQLLSGKGDAKNREDKSEKAMLLLGDNFKFRVIGILQIR
jgi:hypothetical protein